MYYDYVTISGGEQKKNFKETNEKKNNKWK